MLGLAVRALARDARAVMLHDRLKVARRQTAYVERTHAVIRRVQSLREELAPDAPRVDAAFRLPPGDGGGVGSPASPFAGGSNTVSGWVFASSHVRSGFDCFATMKYRACRPRI